MSYELRVRDLKTKIASGFLIASLLAPAGFLFVPEKTYAQVSDSFGLQATIGGIGGVALKCSGLGSKIGDALGSVFGALDTTVATNDVAANKREGCDKAIAQYISKRLLAKLSSDTVNWINNGFKGAPFYVRDPGSFFKSIAEEEIVAFTNEIAFDSANFPFGKDTLTALLAQYQAGFNANAQFSLDKVIQAGTPSATHIDFYNDFNVGGWGAFQAATQFQQNNPVGFAMMAADEWDMRLEGTFQTKAEEVRAGLAQSGGFLNFEACVDPGPLTQTDADEARAAQDKLNLLYAMQGVTTSGGVNTNWTLPPPKTQTGGIGTGYTSTDSSGNSAWVNNTLQNNPALNNVSNQTNAEILELQKIIAENTCRKTEVQTPGIAISSQLTGALNIKKDSLISSDDINNSLGAVFDALMAQLVNKGVNSLTNFTEGSTSQEDLANSGFGFGDNSSGLYTDGSYQSIYNAFQNVDLTTQLPYIIYLQEKWLGQTYVPEVGRSGSFVSGAPNGPPKGINPMTGFPNVDPAPGFGGVPETDAALAKTIYDIQLLDYCIPGPRPTWYDDTRAKMDNLFGELRIKQQDTNDSIVTQITGALTLGIGSAIINGIAHLPLSKAEATLNQALDEYTAHITGIPYENEAVGLGNSPVKFDTGGYLLENMPTITPDSYSEYYKLAGYETTLAEHKTRAEGLRIAVRKLDKIRQDVESILNDPNLTSEEQADLMGKELKIFETTVAALVDEAAIQKLEGDMITYQTGDEYDVFLLEQCSEEINLPEVQEFYRLNGYSWMPYPGIFEYNLKITGGRQDPTKPSGPPTDPNSWLIATPNPYPGITLPYPQMKVASIFPTPSEAVGNDARAKCPLFGDLDEDVLGIPNNVYCGFTFVPQTYAYGDPAADGGGWWNKFMIAKNDPIKEETYNLNKWFADFEERFEIY